MRDQPTTPAQQFKAVRLLSVSAGFKIFNPSRVHFPAPPHFLAVKQGLRNISVLFFRLNGKHIETRYLPPWHDDPIHLAHLEREIGITFKQLRPLPRFNDEVSAQLVVTRQRNEFNILVHGTRLT